MTYKAGDKLTVKQIADYYGIGLSTMHKWLHVGVGPKTCTPEKKTFRYYLFEEVERFRLQYNDTHTTKLQAHMPVETENTDLSVFKRVPIPMTDHEIEVFSKDEEPSLIVIASITRRLQKVCKVFHNGNRGL